MESPSLEMSSDGAAGGTRILGMLEEVGTTGLNAASAVELANRRGQTIQGGSVSSTLSRFKKDGIVDYDGDRYRLPKYAAKTESSQVRSLWGERVAA